MKNLKFFYKAFTTFWTVQKKLLVLLAVLSSVFFYYLLATGGGDAIRGLAKLKEPFTYPTFFLWTWERFNSSSLIGDYFVLITPFIIFYIFFWFKPTIIRFIFPAGYMLLVINYYLPYLKWIAGEFSIPYVLSNYPEYAHQVPYWIKLIFA